MNNPADPLPSRGGDAPAPAEQSSAGGPAPDSAASGAADTSDATLEETRIEASAIGEGSATDGLETRIEPPPELAATIIEPDLDQPPADDSPTVVGRPAAKSARPTLRISDRLDRAPAAETSDDPVVGTVIDDRYKVLAGIGAGGMATVYRAWHLMLEKEVALKLVRPDASSDAVFRQRFFREARVTSALVHPHVAAMREFGEAPDGRLYLVMDYCVGRPLDAVVRAEAPLPAARAVGLLVQLLDALQAAHHQGIVHRDIKPANVVIGDGDRVWVLDFGLATLLGAGAASAEDLAVSSAGAVLGTPVYMSPEQADGRPCDARADIYACGVVAYELLAGKPPFVGRSLMELIRQHIEADPPPLSVRGAPDDVPAALERVVRRALAKDADDRWSSAAAFADALQRALAGDDPAPARRRRGALALAAGLVAVGLAGGLGWALTQQLRAGSPQALPPEPTTPEVPAPVDVVRPPAPEPDVPDLEPLRADVAAARQGLTLPLVQRYASDVLAKAEAAAAQGAGPAETPDAARAAGEALREALFLYRQAVATAQAKARVEADAARRALAEARRAAHAAAGAELVEAQLATLDGEADRLASADLVGVLAGAPQLAAAYRDAAREGDQRAGVRGAWVALAEARRDAEVETKGAPPEISARARRLAEEQRALAALDAATHPVAELAEALAALTAAREAWEALRAEAGQAKAAQRASADRRRVGELRERVGSCAAKLAAVGAAGDAVRVEHLQGEARAIEARLTAWGVGEPSLDLNACEREVAELEGASQQVHAGAVTAVTARREAAAAGLAEANALGAVLPPEAEAERRRATTQLAAGDRARRAGALGRAFEAFGEVVAQAEGVVAAERRYRKALDERAKLVVRAFRRRTIEQIEADLPWREDEAEHAFGGRDYVASLLRRATKVEADVAAVDVGMGAARSRVTFRFFERTRGRWQNSPAAYRIEWVWQGGAWWLARIVKEEP